MCLVWKEAQILVLKLKMGSMGQKGRLHLEPASDSLEPDDGLYQIFEDQPLLGNQDFGPEPTRVGAMCGLTIIWSTVSVLFVSCTLNGLVTLNVPYIASEFGLKPGVEIW